MVKLKFKRWWYYLKPKYRRWLRDCNREINKPENIDEILKEYKTRMDNMLLYGTSHPEIDNIYGSSPIADAITDIRKLNHLS